MNWVWVVLAAGAGADPERARWEVIWWGVVLVLVALAGGVAVLWVRRKYLDKDGAEQAAEGFTLADLRALRDRGEMTAAEYEAARAKLIAQVKGEPP